MNLIILLSYLAFENKNYFHHKFCYNLICSQNFMTMHTLRPTDRLDKSTHQPRLFHPIQRPVSVSTTRRASLSRVCPFEPSYLPLDTGKDGTWPDAFVVASLKASQCSMPCAWEGEPIPCVQSKKQLLYTTKAPSRPSGCV